MANYKYSGQMIYKDDAGNNYILYPLTQKDCVEGMEEIDAHLENTSNPHGVTAAQVGAVPFTGGTVTGTLRAGGALAISGYGAAAPETAVSDPVAGQLYVRLV